MTTKNQTAETVGTEEVIDACKRVVADLKFINANMDSITKLADPDSMLKLGNLFRWIGVLNGTGGTFDLPGGKTFKSGVDMGLRAKYDFTLTQYHTMGVIDPVKVPVIRKARTRKESPDINDAESLFD